MALVHNAVIASPYGKGVIGGFAQPASCSSGTAPTSGSSLTGVGALLPGLLGACESSALPACTHASQCNPSQALDVCEPGEVGNYWILDRTALGSDACTPSGPQCSKPGNCGSSGGSASGGIDPGQVIAN